MVYSRQHRQRRLTFLHSGKLWHDALVLLDEQTGSLWAQTNGEAIAGPLAGARLRRIPSEITTWGDWLRAHPDTWVLPSERRRRKLRMRLYPRASGMLGVLGTENPDPRLPGKTLVVGLLEDGRAFAIPLARERKPQTIRVTVNDRPFRIDHAGGQGPTTVWRSTGPPEWRALERLPASTLYWFVWSSMYPETGIAEPE